MRRNNVLKLAMGCFLALAASFAATDASSAPPPAPGDAVGCRDGRRVRQPCRPTSGVPLDARTPSRAPRRAERPTLIWETLEHGEKVECLDCIPVVAPLLYDSNAKNREIAAWWLRRRIFGVFGPGEVYEQTRPDAPDATATRSSARTRRTRSASSSRRPASRRAHRPW